MSDEDKSNKGVRRAISRNLMKVGFIRNWYIRRTLRYIDKSKEKGRRLPPEFADMDRALSRVPKAQRAKVLEEAMAAGQQGLAESNRAYRRAAGNQNRQSGRGRGRSRPGLPPGAMQQARKEQAKRKG
ncbi:MAG: hypothetical protein FWC87_06570 [Acidimicrobiaceae bacterium]|nr:hypothetical protein [Acidimicrobiaceae bacterium]